MWTGFFCQKCTLTPTTPSAAKVECGVGYQNNNETLAAAGKGSTYRLQVRSEWSLNLLLQFLKTHSHRIRPRSSKWDNLFAK